MRKMAVLALTFVGALLLTGCDFIGGSSGIEDAWYDEMNESINITYSIGKPSADAETGDRPDENLYLEARHRDYDEWFEVVALDDYSSDNLQIGYRFDNYGDFEIRVVARDLDGNLMRETESGWIYINQPQYIHDFNAWFDQWSGEVRFNLSINAQASSIILIQKSTDGGLTWMEVLSQDVEVNEFDDFKSEIAYYEYDEGNYVYRISVFDAAGEFLSEMTTYGETNVFYETKVFEGEPDIWHVSANIDIYSQMVNIWWDNSGAYETAVIEKSTDGESWVLVGEVPRIAQSLNYQELEDGEYYYRVTAMVDGAAAVSHVSENMTRVKLGAIIGMIDGWIEWETQNINLNWEFPNEQVAAVRLERQHNDGEFEVVGDFGNLKKMHTDEALEPGSYHYKLIVLDETGIEIDSMISQEFFIDAPNYLYHINANFDWNSGEVMFYFGLDQFNVSTVRIEKSSDGGETWPLALEWAIDEDNYQDFVRYYEFYEGLFTFRMFAFDEDGNQVGEVYLGYDIDINFDNLNLDEPTDIHFVDVSSDIYSQYVNVWWGSQGVYFEHILEKSTDGETWEFIENLPRMAQSFNYQEETDGNYYYRVTAVAEDGTELDSQVTEYYARVKQGALIGSIDGWYDWGNSTVQLNWDLLSDNVEAIRLERKEADELEFTVIGEFGNLKRQFEDEVILSGNYVYRLTVLDTDGTVLDELLSKEFYIEAPQHVYHLNVWFDQNTGEVDINFGINEFRVVSYDIEKSLDGGLTWINVLTKDVEFIVNGYKSDTEYYELDEGSYVYRMNGYDVDGNNIGTAYAWNEITVQYDINLDDPVDMYHVDGNYNIYNDTVSLWWNGQGTFETFLIERSVDDVAWETVASVVRIATYYEFEEAVDASYYYRVSAVATDGTVLDTVKTNYVIRVKEDALIGHFNVWNNADDLELNWDFIDEDVAMIQVSRKLVGDADFTLLGSYGHLKRVLFDSPDVTGDYVYKLVLLAEDGTILDELESYEVHVEINPV